MKRQYDFYQIGLMGCYLDCIAWCAGDFAKRIIDLYQAYQDGNANGTVGPDCFVKFPELVMGNLTGRKWAMTKEALDYQTKPEEYEITRYEWQEVSTLHGHFVVTDGAGGIVYDPFGDSETVRKGKPVSKRIFRRVA